MKVQSKSHNLTPVIIGFSLLLIGIFQITAFWLLTKAILSNVRESSGFVDTHPAEISPQIDRKINRDSF